MAFTLLWCFTFKHYHDYKTKHWNKMSTYRKSNPEKSRIFGLFLDYFIYLVSILRDKKFFRSSQAVEEVELGLILVIG